MIKPVSKNLILIAVLFVCSHARASFNQATARVVQWTQYLSKQPREMGCPECVYFALYSAQYGFLRCMDSLLNSDTENSIERGVLPQQLLEFLRAVDRYNAAVEAFGVKWINPRLLGKLAQDASGGQLDARGVVQLFVLEAFKKLKEFHGVLCGLGHEEDVRAHVGKNPFSIGLCKLLVDRLHWWWDERDQEALVKFLTLYYPSNDFRPILESVSNIHDAEKGEFLKYYVIFYVMEIVKERDLVSGHFDAIVAQVERMKDDCCKFICSTKLEELYKIFSGSCRNVR